MDTAVRHDEHHADVPRDAPRDALPHDDAVGQALVARQLEEQIASRFPVGRRLRVLDVALRHGLQALALARAGHEVTGLESDPALADAVRRGLEEEPAGIRERMRVVPGDSRSTGAHFLPGSFDVVLCHGVLAPGDEAGPLLAGLGRVLAPGGLLSLLVPNTEAAAMRPGLAGDWAGALNRLAPPGPAERALRREALTATLAGMSTPVHRWYGVRVFTGESGALPGGEAGQRLLAAEERAGRTDPYRAVAALLHLCAVRG